MLRRNLLSALLTALLQYETAALRLHAGTKTVRDFTIVLVRLISTLQCRSSSLSQSFNVP